MLTATYSRVAPYAMDDSMRLIACLLLLGATVAVRAASPETRLAADYAAWQSARAAHDQRSGQGQIDPAEAREYARFLDELRQRVAAGCGELRDQGHAPPSGVECPVETAPAAVPLAPTRATTRDEGGAALDSELRESLGEFDERLLREQDRVRAARPLRDTATVTSGRDADGLSSGSSGGAAAGTAAAGGLAEGATAPAASGQGGAGATAGEMPPGPATGGSATADGAGEPGLGTASGQHGAPPPGVDLPDASGDDVVARQLREAAERERDPALRARLWEEYRRYRSGIR